MSTIVGRKHEIEELERLYYSDRPEFVAVYGRRRVGKTYLIKQALKDKFTFQHTGVSPVDQEDDKNRMKTQLESFYVTIPFSTYFAFAGDFVPLHPQNTSNYV